MVQSLVSDEMVKRRGEVRLPGPSANVGDLVLDAKYSVQVGVGDRDRPP